MAKYRFPCSSCGREIQIDESAVTSAEKVKCPVCDSVTGIPTDVIEDVLEARLAKEQKRQAKREVQEKRQEERERRRREREQVWKAEEGKRAEDRAEALRQEAEGLRRAKDEARRRRLGFYGARTHAPQYPAVRFISAILKVVAILVLVGAAVAIILGLAACLEGRAVSGVSALVTALWVGLLGCYMYATGELLVVLPDIRADTWATVQLLDEMKARREET